MNITIVAEVEWKGHEPFTVNITVDPPTVKLPQDVIESIKDNIEMELCLNEPVELVDAKVGETVSK